MGPVGLDVLKPQLIVQGEHRPGDAGDFLSANDVPTISSGAVFFRRDLMMFRSSRINLIEILEKSTDQCQGIT